MCEASVIIVNWNGAHHLPGCLESLMNQTYRDFEVVVVDNGSMDNSVAYVKEHFPQVKLVCLDTNRGFTGGNWAGYEIAKGSFIALLNNDARAEPGWLGSLVSIMHSNPEVGICASRIIMDGSNMIDSAGDRFTTAFTGTKIGYRQPANLFDMPHAVQGGCAAAILYRRCMLDEIGFLDDDFFFNHEDTDLNLRAWLAGWKCSYVPDAIVYHKVSASIGHLSAKTIYYFSRNNEWVWLKNVPFSIMIILLPQRLIYELFSLLFYGFLSGHLLSFIKGKLDALKRITLILNKRKKIMPQIKLSHRKIVKELMPISRYLIDRALRQNERKNARTSGVGPS